MSADIFVSFASQDLKVATTLCKALEGRGFRCWISSRDILPGENFQVAIVRAIRMAKMMLLVFTANSNNSEEMTKELALASQHKLIVVPLRIEDVAPNDAFAYEFATRQWIDFFADWETAMNQLSERIANALTPDGAAREEALAGGATLRPAAKAEAPALAAASTVALVEPAKPKTEELAATAKAGAAVETLEPPAAKAPPKPAPTAPVVELKRPDAKAPPTAAPTPAAAPAAKAASPGKAPDVAKPPATASTISRATAPEAVPPKASASRVGLYVAIALIVIVVIGGLMMAPQLFLQKPPPSAAVAAQPHAPPPAQPPATAQVIPAAPGPVGAPPAVTPATPGVPAAGIAAAPGPPATNALAPAQAAKPAHKRPRASSSSEEAAPPRATHGETEVPF